MGFVEGLQPDEGFFLGINNQGKVLELLEPKQAQWQPDSAVGTSLAGMGLDDIKAVHAGGMDSTTRAAWRSRCGGLCR
jgi:hypothetical protein